ncbi:hypothetical protein DENSPDRAFT_839043, partial [Dentipellis sp. KUC8613]
VDYGQQVAATRAEIESSMSSTTQTESETLTSSQVMQQSGADTTENLDELTDEVGNNLSQYNLVPLGTHIENPPVFRNGGTSLRKYLPTVELPTFLDAEYAKFPAKDLPLVWYGFPFSHDNAEIYAKKHDLIAPYLDFRTGLMVDGEVDLQVTHSNVLMHVLKTFKSTKIKDTEVWGLKGKRTFIFAFCSNHDLETRDWGDYQDDIERFVEEFGFKSRECGAWYLDIDYEL